MAVLDRLPVIRDLQPAEIQPCPPEIDERVKRGRARMREDATKRQECIEFWRGNQHCWVSSDNHLINQSTTWEPSGKGKPRHRMRTTRNLIVEIVGHKVSAATQRVPSYEVGPSTTDPKDIAAARMAEKVALFGYDRWSVRQATEAVVTYAAVADEGFAWPYFDNTVGPYIQGPDGSVVGIGEIKIRVFGPNEIYWEPGIQFNDSRWHAVEQALSIDDVYELDGYLGGKLTSDAQSATPQSESVRRSKHLVLVTDYLERPCPKYPNGRWLTLANGRVIVAERAYPCVNANGAVSDEPVLHKLSFISDPSSDRDMGLVRHLLDAQRVYNDVTNRLLEWKNLALMPQVIALPGVMRTRLTDEPGAVIEVSDLNGVKWRDTPNIPGELFQMLNQAQNDMLRIAADNDIPNQVEASAAIQTLIERDQNIWQSFIVKVAEFHSQLMRHCLYLVQRHYTEPRLLKIQGQFGLETIDGFMGADLRSQVDVTVAPGSIEPRTKDQIRSQVMQYAQMGWISGDEAMAAIDNGTAEGVIQDYELQVSQQQRELQQMLMLGPTLHPDFTNEDHARGGIPEAKEWNDHAIHRKVLHDFMATADFDNLPYPVQYVIENHDRQHKAFQDIARQQAAQQQAMAAQSLGMAGAATPPSPPGMPSPPNPSQ